MTGKHKHDSHKHTDPEASATGQDIPVTGGDAGQPAETAPEDLPEDPATLLKEEVAALNDKYLRLYSEFDNFRKRTLKERIELSKTASADVIRELLPVVDDLERAIKAHPEAEGPMAVLTDGVTLIYNKLMATLTQQGLEPVNSIGEEFTTDLHEAVAHVPATEPGLKGKVVDEIQRGYILNGKVIRFAKVVVGS